MSTALSRHERAAALVVVIALASWMVWSRGSDMPPVSPLGDQLTYSLQDRHALILLEPVLHAPWLGRVPAFLALGASALVLACALFAARRAGASLLSSLCMLALLAMDRGFAEVVVHGGWSAASLAFAWLASAVAFGEPDDDLRAVSTAAPSWVREAVLLVVWGMAVWWSWLAVMAWPIVIFGVSRAPDTRIRSIAIVLSVVVGMLAIAAHFQALVSEAHSISYAPGIVFDWRDAVAVAFDERPGVPKGSYVHPDAVASLPHLALALIALGGITASPPSGGRRAIAVSVAVAGTLYVVFPVWREEILRYLTWGLVPLVAVGLTWCAARAPRPRLASAIVLSLGAAMVVATAVADARPVGGADSRWFRDALVERLDGAGPNLALVSEDTRVDSAIAAWLAARPGDTRLVPDGAVVAEAVSEGRTVLAGPESRRQLELQGLSFETMLEVAEPAAYALSSPTAVYHCTTVRSDRWSLLPGLEYTGRVGVLIPPSIVGELRVIVGDGLPVQVRASLPHGEPMPIRVETLLAGSGVAAPPADYWFERGVPEDAPDRVVMLHLEPHPVSPRLVSLHLGRRSPRVLARLDGVAPSARARICAAPIGAPVVRGDEGQAVAIPLTSEALFGTGWYGVEGAGTDRFRWMDSDGVVLVPSAAKTPVRVTFEAASGTVPAGESASGQTVTLRVNALEMATLPTSGAMQRYEWDVPASAWLAGTNELWFHASRAVRPADAGGEDTRWLAMAVRAIAVRPQKSGVRSQE